MVVYPSTVSSQNPSPCKPDLEVFCDQALSQKEAEKAAVMERVAALQQDLATAGMELERTQREALSRQEQDKVKTWHCHIGAP